MPEMNILDGLVLVKASDDDLTAEVTALGTYTDISGQAITFTTPQDSVSNSQVRPHGTNRRSRVLPGTITSTASLSFAYNPGNTPDVAKVMRDILKGATHGRANFVIQPKRTPLLATVADAGATPPIAVGDLVPAASAANPQYAFSAVINAHDQFGAADGTGPAVGNVTLDVDRDYMVYDS